MKLPPLRTAVVLASSVAILAACGAPEADPAGAGTVSVQALVSSACFDAVATLKAQTLVVRFKASKDQAGLVTKLDEAAQKLSANKPLDAVQKLTDYALKVQALIAQGKIAASLDGTVTPAMLLSGAQAAIDCIVPPPPDPTPSVSGG